MAYTNEAFELKHLSCGICCTLTTTGVRWNAINTRKYLKDALRRAESLLAEYGTNHNPQQDNPCTTVHFLVKALRENISPQD